MVTISFMNINISYDACMSSFNAIGYLLLIITCQYKGFDSSVVTPILTVEFKFVSWVYWIEDVNTNQ